MRLDVEFGWGANLQKEEGRLFTSGAGSLLPPGNVVDHHKRSDLSTALSCFSV